MDGIDCAPKGGERDRELVGLIGRHGGMSIGQLMSAMGVGRTAAYRRFQRCEEAGLVERLRLTRTAPTVLHATRDGLRYAGLGLSVAAISPGSVDHALRCTAYALDLERRYGEGCVLTEREIILAELVDETPVASVEVSRKGPRLHRADLAVMTGDGTIAVEVELTPKTPRRLDNRLRAWRRAALQNGAISEVRYICEPGQTRRAVERAIRRTKTESVISVDCACAAPTA
jgi:DNA-binding Lrp family transcriptional regulator